MTISGDTNASPRRQFTQRLRLELPGTGISATAILKPRNCNTEHRQSFMAYPDGGRIHLLRMTSVCSVPASFLQTTWFRLYINTDDDGSQRYVNGLVHRLSQTYSTRMGRYAALARVERNKDLVGIDPFSATPANASGEIDWLAGGHSYALVYMARDCPQTQWYLVLHLLEAPRTLVPLATIPDAQQQRLAVSELEFIRMLARKYTEQARIQRTLSTENMMRSSESLGRRNSSFGRRPRRGRMTLTDIEIMMKEQTLASANNSPDLSSMTNGQSFAQPPIAFVEPLAEPSEEVEQKNKRVAKQLIIASLKERGVGRSHQDFAALWSQIYRSLKFALRDKIGRRVFAPRELKAESDKHANFYCSSTV
ncbi:hypothetical protein H4R99_005511 [Coemansia sp. RSA 1722]|nr:hypothetical protein LPJ57_007832 [Coemansia sp. RSA 486]KAJ2223021.1 hypothetical protein IWW45_008448 [Coemansia sp. RSA 485]KAJ2595044.1 hypothetical protein H4R99_005511 [Coemansia sp. RSA 1722]